MIIIRNDDLRDHLKRICCKPQDCDLTEDDLKSIKYLEITTEEKQLWDEDDDSLITSSFYQIDDLGKFPNLVALNILDQPLKGMLTLPPSIEEITITKCLGVHLSIGEESYVVPPSEHPWMWIRGRHTI